MSRWIALPILLCLAACTAQHPSTTRKEAAQAFITETAIDVPERAHSTELVNAGRAGAVGAGIMASYRSARLPDARIDLFVYPAGRLPEEEALARGIDGFLESVAAAEEHGSYSNAKVESSKPFAATRGDHSPLRVHKIALHMTEGDSVLASRTWIAYKQNYWFKLRMTAALAFAGVLDDEGDPLARELFDKASALSKGACGEITITLPSEDVDAIAVADTFLEAASRLQRAGCAGAEYPDLATGFRRVLLPFPPGSWD